MRKDRISGVWRRESESQAGLGRERERGRERGESHVLTGERREGASLTDFRGLRSPECDPPPEKNI